MREPVTMAEYLRILLESLVMQHIKRMLRRSNVRTSRLLGNLVCEHCCSQERHFRSRPVRENTYGGHHENGQLRYSDYDDMPGK